MPKTFSLISLALKNLKRKSFRTGVIAFSIALVVSLLVFGLTFIVTVTSSIQRATERLGADLLVIPMGVSRFADEVLLETESKSFFMNTGIMDRVRRIEGVEAITSQTYLTTIVGLCCDVPEAKVVAFNQDTDFIVGPWLNKAIGRRLKKGEAIVGKESFLNISLGLMEVDANLFGNRFQIVGSLEKTGTGLDNAIFITEENVPDIIRNGKTTLKPGQISIIFTKVKKGYDPYAVGRSVEGEILEVDVIARKDIGKNIISTLRDVSKIFTMTMVIASVLSLLLVWAIFSAIVNERSKEVGIMRALGAKERHIVRIFFIEVLLLASVGGALGIVFGSTLSVVLAKGFTIMKHLSAELSGAQRFAVYITSFISGLVICIAGALAPIQRLKKLEPLMVIKAD